MSESITSLKLERAKLSCLVDNAFDTPNPSHALMAAALAGDNKVKQLTRQINELTNNEANKHRTQS